MKDMIHDPIPLVDLNQDDYEQGGEKEEEVRPAPRNWASKRVVPDNLGTLV